MPVRMLLGLIALLLAGCATMPAPRDPAAALAAIEASSGGRLGVALVDDDGRRLAGYRAEERFAMCSTFKLALGAMALDRAAAGGPALATPLVFTRADLVPYAPVMQPLIGDRERAETTIGVAAAAAATVSDNVAANLLLRQYGGPAALTAWLRALGDAATRLDRTETALNENVPGDLRDTSTPAAFAQTSRQLLLGDRLAPQDREMLRQWLTDSRTGLARIRSALPTDWQAGDKTGNCGTAFNDIAFIRSDTGHGFVVAVYLDRPDLDQPGADAAIAEVTRVLLPLMH